MAKKTVVKRKSGAAKAVPKKSTKKSARPTGAKAQKKPASRKSAKARPPKGPVWQWSALQTAAAIRSGAISSTEVVEAHIARMRDVNPKLNAVVVDLSEDALRAAKAADNARTKKIEPGPLIGDATDVADAFHELSLREQLLGLGEGQVLKYVAATRLNARFAFAFGLLPLFFSHSLLPLP